MPSAKVSGHKVDLAEELMKFVKNFFTEIKKVNEENKKIRAHNRTAIKKEQKEAVLKRGRGAPRARRKSKEPPTQEKPEEVVEEVAAVEKTEEEE